GWKAAGREAWLVLEISYCPREARSKRAKVVLSLAKILRGLGSRQMLLEGANLASFDSRSHAAIGRWPETSRNRWSAKGRSIRSKRRPICIVKFWSKKDA